MGKTFTKPQKLIKAYIHPVPGTSGCPVKKKNILSVYTDKEIISLKISKEMTGTQVRSLLQKKTGQEYSLHLNNIEILYTQTITELGITENSLVRAVPSTTESEKPSFTKSVIASHRRTQSTNCSGVNLEADLSVYAVPEVGQLTKKSQHHRKSSNISRVKTKGLR